MMKTGLGHINVWKVTRHTDLLCVSCTVRNAICYCSAVLYLHHDKVSARLVRRLFSQFEEVQRRRRKGPAGICRQRCIPVSLLFTLLERLFLPIQTLSSDCAESNTNPLAVQPSCRYFFIIITSSVIWSTHRSHIISYTHIKLYLYGWIGHWEDLLLLTCVCVDAGTINSFAWNVPSRSMAMKNIDLLVLNNG